MKLKLQCPLSLIGTQPQPCIYILSVAALSPNSRGWRVATEIIWPEKLNSSRSGPAQKQFAASCCKGSAVMPPSLSWILSPRNPVVSSCQLVIPPGARGTRRRRQEESCLSRAGLLPSPSPTSAVTRALLCDTINSDKAETVPPRISKQKLFIFPTKTVTKSLVKSRFP